MDIQEILAKIQAMPPEEQAKAMQMFNQQQQAPGMPPMSEQPQQQVDPRMGMPGLNNPMPGGPDTHRDFAGEGSVVGDQQAQAEALRGTATPEGMHTRNAGFVAANPLSHMATAVQRIRGNLNAAEALEAKKKLSTDLSTNNKVNAQQEFDRKTKAQAKADAVRKGATPMELMAANEQQNDSNFL